VKGTGLDDFKVSLSFTWRE